LSHISIFYGIVCFQVDTLTLELEEAGAEIARANEALQVRFRLSLGRTDGRMDGGMVGLITIIVVVVVCRLPRRSGTRRGWSWSRGAR